MPKPFVCSLTAIAIALGFTASASPLPPSIVAGGENDGTSIVSSQYLPPDQLSSEGYDLSLSIDNGSLDTSSFKGACNGRYAWGYAKLQTHVTHWTMFTYKVTVGWSWCNFKVTAVNYVLGEPVDSNAGWGWVGNLATQINPPRSYFPATPVTVTQQGHFKNCVVWFCKDRYPWVQLRVNGSGNVTGFAYGV